MEILLDKIRELSQYQGLLKQLQTNSQQLPGLGLPRATRLPVLAALAAVSKKGFRFLEMIARDGHAECLCRFQRCAVLGIDVTDAAFGNCHQWDLVDTVLPGEQAKVEAAAKQSALNAGWC